MLLANIHLSLPRGNIKKHTSKPNKRQYLCTHPSIPRGNVHTYIRAYQEAILEYSPGSSWGNHTYISRSLPRGNTEYSPGPQWGNNTYISRAYQEAISKYSLGPLWDSIIHTYLAHRRAMSKKYKKNKTFLRKGYIIMVQEYMVGLKRVIISEGIPRKVLDTATISIITHNKTCRRISLICRRT